MVVPDDGGLEQYEVVWILPRQSPLLGRPQGFALEIVDFLGPGDPDERGERTVWVRGRVIDTDRRPAEFVTVAVPHDQPRVPAPGLPA